MAMLESCGDTRAAATSELATTGEKVLGNVVDVRVQLAPAVARTAPMLFVEKGVAVKVDLSRPMLMVLLHAAQVKKRNLWKMYY